MLRALAACGNQQCEFGEECKDEACSTGCAVDCPRYFPDMCARSGCSGHGSCQHTLGKCACFTGYTGDNCDVCVEGFQPGAYGSCVYRPTTTASCTDGVKNGHEMGVDCGGPNCRPCEPRQDGAMWAGIAVGGCALIGAIAGVMWCKRNTVKKQRGQAVLSFRDQGISGDTSWRLGTQRAQAISVIPTPSTGGPPWSPGPQGIGSPFKAASPCATRGPVVTRSTAKNRVTPVVTVVSPRVHVTPDMENQCDDSNGITAHHV